MKFPKPNITVKKVLEFQLNDNELLSQSFFSLFPKESESDKEDNRERDYWK